MALIPKKTFSFGDQIFEAGVPLTKEQEGLIWPERLTKLIANGWLHDTDADPGTVQDRLDSLEADIIELRQTVARLEKQVNG